MLGAERAVLVGVELPDEPIDERLRELEALASTAGVPTVARTVQRRGRPDPSLYIGRGKVAEVQSAAAETDADVVIFDHALSPAQARNLEEALGCKVIDRSQLILDIFAQRATTKESKLQVELAQLRYLLPRLRGWGAALTRLGGGIGTRGPGETQLELDRYKVMRRIHSLERRLRRARGERDLRRRRRERSDLPRVALVGYTNSGKSTLLNVLADASSLVEDKLFATLTPAVRRADLGGGRTVLVIDTVGFVQALPHELVPAFASTLEAAREAQVILHVIDAASADALGQRDVVIETLTASVFDGHPMPPRIDVWNKADLVGRSLDLHTDADDGVAISALRGDGIEELRARIIEVLDRRCGELGRWLVPFAATSLVHELRRHHELVIEGYTESGMRIVARLPHAQCARLRGSGAVPLEDVS
ncbi:MAG: GTPase HflX [Candidatus Bipolaricaulota bacterium]|nr:MAG: GTPase HflX [Candidatus Bipolaricaulota bacterium]